ncbi:hypothetical protein IAT38_001883 [Cryptococcus sp. DSM 104549]
MPLFGKSKYQPKGKHCYVTGGSSGLGKALSESLVKQGAHVSIVGRDIKKAEAVVAELKAIASPSQIIQAVQADLSNPVAAAQALKVACAAHGGVSPEYVYCCAGFSKPKFFVECSTEELKEGIDGVYWVTAYTVHEVIKMMVKQRRTGKVVFVASLLGYTSFVGYSMYSPAKYALRGLADTLRSEMLLHGIDIHIFMPAGIVSPGYEVENVTKPEVTKKIEETDTPLAPEVSAAHLEAGLRKGYYGITDNLVTDLIRLRSDGGVPTNNFFLDTAYLFISSFGVPIWRMITDSTVRAAAKDVRADYESTGFYDAK